jgi:uncharacterized protein (TIGR02996 family)
MAVPGATAAWYILRWAMSDEHELYAAILAEPNDPAPRRALAAHYDRKGDPHGELIRVQLDLADKRSRGERDPKLLRREDELLKAHGRAWAAPLADLIAGYKLHRGLIGEVTLPLDRFLDVAPTLFAAAPIQHVNLTQPRTRLAELLRSPHIARLSSLALASLGLGDNDAKAIARADALRTLHYLSLAHNKIGETGVEALAASPYLARLDVLDLTNNPCDPVPRPGGRDLDGRVTAIDRPALANVLVSRYGERPWLANPANPDAWPLPRDAYR